MYDLIVLLPLCLTVGSGILLLLMEVLVPPKQRPLLLNYTAIMSILGVALSTIWVYKMTLTGAHSASRLMPWGAFFVFDYLAVFFYVLCIFATFCCIVLSAYYLGREKILHGEYYALLFFALSGMMILASSADLMTLFVGLEVMSMSVYILVGFRRQHVPANEAALKYFFLGSLASSLLLYGVVLFYGLVGATSLEQIRAHLTTHGFSPVAGLALAFMLTGLAIKVAAVPFHVWAPDAYEGAPIPITGWMATAVKSAIFALLLRVLLEGLLDFKTYWQDVIWWLAVLSMFGGNLLAFSQQNVKRLFAYSSIAHTGYLLVGVVSLSSQAQNQALSAILYYLLVYVIASCGVFAALTVLSAQGECHTQVTDLAGAYQAFPVATFMLALLILSFIGVPPLAGFFAKYDIFATAISEQHTTLAFIGILNSLLAVYYYLRVLVVIYMQPAKAHWEPLQFRPLLVGCVLIYATVAILWLGIGTFNLFGLFWGLTPAIDWLQLVMLNH